MPLDLNTILSQMTLEEKIGQMLCLGWSGGDSYLTLNAHARGILSDIKPGGLILMGRNVQDNTSPIDIIRVKGMLAEAQALSKVPLFICVDQEGGRVARFGNPPFVRMPTAKAIGDRDDVSLARKAATVTGRELAAVGVNFNFAPVADVNSNPQNPVIGDRAFSDNPHTTANMVVAQVAGYRDAGVLSCLKHFPGHGDTNLDSHYDLPTVDFTLDQMAGRELFPFVAGIAADVPAIMTAHIVCTQLDPEYPATLSEAILTGLLRDGMDFGGLIVTDCLEMKAVADKWGTPQAALEAAKAGADILLICHTEAVQRESFALLCAAANSGDLPESRITESVSRILLAKMKLSLATPPSITAIGSDEHQAVRDAFNVIVATEATTLGENAPA
jgi:beta-N-acetylhexosaminidase